MYKLFYADFSAAMGTRAVLEEIGAEYELLVSSIDLDEPRPPELLALNPNGWVPVLIYDGGTMHEASAITVFLTDRHPEAGLAPAADDPLRGPFLQWLVYMSNTLQMAYQLTYYPLRFCESEEHIASARARSCIRLREIWGMIDEAIGDNDWLVGKPLHRSRHPCAHVGDLAKSGHGPSDHRCVSQCRTGHGQCSRPAGRQEGVRLMTGRLPVTGGCLCGAIRWQADRRTGMGRVLPLPHVPEGLGQHLWRLRGVPVRRVSLHEGRAALSPVLALGAARILPGLRFVAGFLARRRRGAGDHRPRPSIGRTTGRPISTTRASRARCPGTRSQMTCPSRAKAPTSKRRRRRLRPARP